MGYDVDTSDSQDKAYIDFERQRAAKAIEEFPMSEDVLTCREIIKFLKETEDGEPRIVGVDIPFNERIVWTDTENRRNFNIFMDMIRAFAVFRFMQRELSENGSIIATIDDFNDAKRHYSARRDCKHSTWTKHKSDSANTSHSLGASAILRLCRRK